jgi:hypothetical protein
MRLGPGRASGLSGKRFVIHQRVSIRSARMLIGSGLVRLLKVSELRILLEPLPRLRLGRRKFRLGRRMLRLERRVLRLGSQRGLWSPDSFLR